MSELNHFLSKTVFFKTAPENFLESLFGQNRKLFFVGISETPDAESGLAFLKKILLAKALDLETDCCFKAFGPDEHGSFTALLKKRGIERAFFFGLSPRRFGLSLDAKLYEPIRFCGAELLFAEPLSTIESDIERKKRLWAALKQMD